MIFRYTDEEKEQIKALEREAIGAMQKLSDVLNDKSATHEEKSAIKALYTQTTDRIFSDFDNLMEKFEAAHFEALKGPEEIIKNAQQLTKDAIRHALIETKKEIEFDKDSYVKDGRCIIGLANAHFEYVLLYGDWDYSEKIDTIDLNEYKSLFFDKDSFIEYLQKNVLKRHFAALNDQDTTKLLSALDDIFKNDPNIITDPGEPGAKTKGELVEDLITKKHAANIHQKRAIDLNEEHEIVMANTLIQNGVNTLTKNELLLLRIIIMQTKKGDTDLFEYTLSTADLAKMLNITPKGLYRDLRTMLDHIMGEKIKLKDDKTDRWAFISWVQYASYENGKITIRLGDGLKPYLIGLRKYFNKIRLSELVHLKSTYSILLYELISSYMTTTPHAEHKEEIYIPLDVIRRTTNTKNKYKKYSQFKEKVIDVAINEINGQSFYYYITARPEKEGRSYTGFTFTVMSQVAEEARSQNNTIPVEDHKQITLKDLMGKDF